MGAGIPQNLISSTEDQEGSAGCQFERIAFQYCQAAMLRREGREIGDGAAPRYVTAALHVNYLKPTPLGPELVVRGVIKEITDRKVIVEETLSADGVVTATGSVVAVRMPESMVK